MDNHEFPKDDNGHPGYHGNCIVCLKEYLRCADYGVTQEHLTLMRLKQEKSALERTFQIALQKVKRATTQKAHTEAVKARDEILFDINKCASQIYEQEERFLVAKTYVTEALKAVHSIDKTILN